MYVVVHIHTHTYIQILLWGLILGIIDTHTHIFAWHKSQPIAHLSISWQGGGGGGAITDWLVENELNWMIGKEHAFIHSPGITVPNPLTRWIWIKLWRNYCQRFWFLWECQDPDPHQTFGTLRVRCRGRNTASMNEGAGREGVFIGWRSK